MTTTPYSLAQELIRFHKVITRGLEVGLEHGRGYLQEGPAKADLLSGYASYVHSFSMVLGSHHQSEDKIVFPAFRKVLSLAPYEQLTNDHLAIEKQLSALPEAITKINGDEPDAGLAVIADALDQIAMIWYRHIAIEEEYFSADVLSAVMTLDEQKSIGDAAGQYSQEHSNPPYWIVPFIIYNLEHDEREKFTANLPPVITNELVPKTWKEQWKPMKPFLLK